jgi:protein kinase-like protein
MSAPEALRRALAGRYDIVRELGAGGMATAYLARDVKHDRDVALKVLNPDLTESLGRERFLREIRLAARLNHPNILPLYDSGEAAGFLFFVMPVMLVNSAAYPSYPRCATSCPSFWAWTSRASGSPRPWRGTSSAGTAHARSRSPHRERPGGSTHCCTKLARCCSTSVIPAASTSRRGAIGFSLSTPSMTACGSCRHLELSLLPLPC